MCRVWKRSRQAKPSYSRRKEGLLDGLKQADARHEEEVQQVKNEMKNVEEKEEGSMRHKTDEEQEVRSPCQQEIEPIKDVVDGLLCRKHRTEDSRTQQLMFFISVMKVSFQTVLRK